MGLIGPVTRQSPVLEASQVYGIYGTSLLVYHAKHVDGTSAKSINSAGASKELAVDIVPHVNGKAVQIAVLWKGKPLANADVSIFDGDSEPIDKKTDKDGRLSFVPESGKLIGVLATTTKNDKAGTQEGKSYKGVVHYSSLTFNLPGKDSVALNDSAAAEHSTSESKTHAKTTALMPPLPEPLASFGAVVADGWLYVYGGHIGEEHEHSAANLSKHFRRIKLDGGTTWQELPMQTPLQGLSLVAHGGKIYRIGGLNERNPTTGKAEDLHSTADFAEYDPATRKWTSLAPLPAARSSLNATVIGDQLYVVGGWDLTGKSPGSWQPDALVYEFAKPTAGWQKLPRPDFKRRALAAGNWHGKLFALGGMNEKAKPTVRVDVFDPQTGRWSHGPKLPGNGMHDGFGVLAWNVNGGLYVSGLRGVLYAQQYGVGMGRGRPTTNAAVLSPACAGTARKPAGRGRRFGGRSSGWIEKIDLNEDHFVKSRSAKESR